MYGRMYARVHGMHASATSDQDLDCSFSVSPTSLDWVSNEDATRWFLVLRLAVAQPASNALNRLLALTNSAVEVFGQLPLYSRPSSSVISPGDSPDQSDSFHISIAWTFATPTSSIIARTQAAEVKAVLDRDIRSLRIGCERVKVKIGNVVESVMLSSGAEDDSDVGIVGRT